MIDFLIPAKLLIHLALDIGTCPHERPVLLSVFNVPYSIIFTRVSYELDINSFIKLEVIASILGFIRSYAHGVDVRSENQVSLVNLVDDGLLLCLGLLYLLIEILATSQNSLLLLLLDCQELLLGNLQVMGAYGQTLLRSSSIGLHLLQVFLLLR